VDLAPRMCPAGANRDDCFTPRQIHTIQDLYRGSYDSHGTSIFKGMDLGSEWKWNVTMFPHRGNGMLPYKLIYGMDHVNFLFYEKSPGVPMPNPRTFARSLTRTRIRRNLHGGNLTWMM
jgi:hypothetical protein